MRLDPGTTLVACSLEQDSMADRLRRWQTLAAPACESAAPTSNGVRLTFRAVEGAEQELRALVALEQDCCAFADWSVRVNEEQVAVEISAESDEGAAAIQAMFGGLCPRSGGSEPELVADSAEPA